MVVKAVLVVVLFISAIATLSEQKKLSHIDNVAFVKLGSYNDDNNEKTYFVPRYFNAFWVHTRSICKAYGMDIVSLDTLDEAQQFLRICRDNAGYLDQWTHIGGMTLEGGTTDEWYWADSGNHINYTMKFGQGQPDNAGGKELCLSIGKYPGNNFYFNDIRCNARELSFVCQSHSASVIF